MNDMPFPRPATRQETRAIAIVDRLQLTGSIDAIRELIQGLSADWDDLTERQKIGLMKEIDRRFGDLVRVVGVEVVPRNPSIARANGRAAGEVFLSKLTWRELQTLGALIDGGSTSQIAADFGISETTVRSHVKNIFAKLGVHSRIEAVAVAQSRLSRRRGPAGERLPGSDARAPDHLLKRPRPRGFAPDDGWDPNRTAAAT